MDMRQADRGSALVEFTLAVFLLIPLILGGIELMRAYLIAQVLAEGTRIAARDDAAAPTYDPEKRFDARYAAIDLDHLVDPDDEDNEVGSLDELFRRLPPLHMALRTSMIREDRTIDDVERRLLRFPGALFRDPGAPRGRDLLVYIPGRDPEGEGYLLHSILELESWPDGLTRPKLRYHFPFAVFRAEGGESRGTISEADFVNIAGLVPEAYELVHPGFDPPGLLSGRVRNAFATIETSAAARVEGR